jgi:hypothetical protein
MWRVGRTKKPSVAMAAENDILCRLWLFRFASIVESSGCRSKEWLLVYWTGRRLQITQKSASTKQERTTSCSETPQKEFYPWGCRHLSHLKT